MSDDENTQDNSGAEEEQLQISIETIVNKDENDLSYVYYRIKNGPHSGIIFTITEVKFVPVREVYENVPEDVAPEDRTATGRVLFEDTGEFTSKQLLNDQIFSEVVRDVFNHMIQEMIEASKELDAANPEGSDIGNSADE